VNLVLNRPFQHLLARHMIGIVEACYMILVWLVVEEQIAQM
jgi:hypothetical protein